MTHVTSAEVNAYLEDTKLAVASISDVADLDDQVTRPIFARLERGGYSTASWINESSTPALVRTLIAMYIASRLYDRAYADDADGAPYARRLMLFADQTLDSIISGDMEIIEFPTTTGDLLIPEFFPNDDSSATPASIEFPEDGPPSFTMGTVF
jgi:hypothetical protein